MIFNNLVLTRSRLTQKTGGFTLTELLVGMLLAALVITPLLTFMLNIMDTERKEKAKATSEQEIQAALDYIARDLEQAVYIYDDGLIRNNSATPADSGIKDQIPPIAPAPGCNALSKCQPVLFFWKREYNKKAAPLNITNNNCTSSPSSCNDTFVYSLVGYYLIKDDNDTWSKAARIGRFQIQDGIRAPNNNGTLSYISATNGTPNGPSNGFRLFDLSLAGNSLKDKMNQWTKGTQTYTNQAVVLLDYIDQSTDEVPQVNCPDGMKAVPPYSNPAVTNTFKTYSFYACVDSSRTVAQVFLRGNALARIENDAIYSGSNSTYFPQASIQVKGRGFLEAR
jgi:type II secretory pathway pseudopilin PulG